jgi:hypothetical protein
MINPIHIIKGWFASKIFASDTAIDFSNQRLLLCEKCPFTKQSKILKFINGEAKEIDTLVCTGCSKNFHCPVVEKSLVKNETCPKKYWKI